MKNRRWRWVAAVAAALLVDTAGAVNLSEAYALAGRNDPVFESGRRVYGAAQERTSQALAGLLPELKLTGHNQHIEGDVSFDESPEIHRDYRTRTLKLELVQPLFRIQNWASFSQSRLLEVQAEAQHRQARQDLAVRVAQAYFDVLAAEDSLAVAESQKQAVAAQLDLVSRGHKAGTATITDVHEARSRHELAQSQVIAARNEREIRQSALEQIIGESPGGLASLRATAVLPSPQPAGLGPWIEAAQTESPSVQAARAGAEAADREVTRAQGGHWPTVDLVAARARDYSGGSLTSPTSLVTESESTSVGIQFTLPLFASGGTQARVREAKELSYKAQADLETARRAAAHGARQAHSAVVNGLSQIGALNEAVKASESAVEGNRVGYRVGTRLNVDVLDAQQQLFAARRDLARARYDTLVQVLRLKAAAGRLADEDMAAVNALLESR